MGLDTTTHPPPPPATHQHKLLGHQGDEIWYVDLTHKYKVIQGVLVGGSQSLGGSPSKYNFFYCTTIQKQTAADHFRPKSCYLYSPKSSHILHANALPPPPKTSHASDFNLFFRYHFFNSYINTLIICNCKSTGLLGYIMIFVDEIFHKLTSHNTDLFF